MEKCNYTSDLCRLYRKKFDIIIKMVRFTNHTQNLYLSNYVRLVRIKLLNTIIIKVDDNYNTDKLRCILYLNRGHRNSICKAW